MLPIRFDPAREPGTLQREMDDLFKRIFGSNQEIGERNMLTTTPTANSFIKEGGFHLEAELPGVGTDKLDIRIADGNLVIHGERRSSHKTKDVDYLLQESSSSTFERRMPLSAGAIIEKAHASYQNGMFEVTVPTEVLKPTGRKTPVEGAKIGKRSKEIH